MKQWLYLSLVVSSLLYADSVDEALDGFDDISAKAEMVQGSSSEADEALEGFAEEAPDGHSDEDQGDVESTEEQKGLGIEGLTGSLSQLFAYSYLGKMPHRGLRLPSRHSIWIMSISLATDGSSRAMPKPIMMLFMTYGIVTTQKRRRMPIAVRYGSMMPILRGV